MKYRYDWSEIQRFYDGGNSYRACRKKFGFASVSWTKAVSRGDIVPRPTRRPVEEVLNTPGDRAERRNAASCKSAYSKTGARSVASTPGFPNQSASSSTI